MKQFFQRNKLAAIIILVTIVVAGVAIFTALRLYQLREQSVSPNVPQSTPGATGNPNIVSCEAVTFAIGDTPTPTPTPTVTPSPIPTVAASATPLSSATPRPSASVSPRPSITPISTVAPSSTPAPSLPPAGVSTPTIVGIGAAIILLIGAIVLAL